MSCVVKVLFLYCLAVTLIMCAETEAAVFSAIKNGGFELGMCSWRDQNVDVRGELFLTDEILINPFEGESQAVMSPYGGSFPSILRQKLSANVGTLTVSFDYNILSITPFVEDVLSDSELPADVFKVSLTDDNAFYKEVLWINIPEVNREYQIWDISDWLHYENEFECDGGTNPYLEFALVNSENQYQFSTAFIDNVKVTFVPVPSTLLLLGSGFIISLCCLRIRRRGKFFHNVKFFFVSTFNKHLTISS